MTVFRFWRQKPCRWYTRYGQLHILSAKLVPRTNEVRENILMKLGYMVVSSGLAIAIGMAGAASADEIEIRFGTVNDRVVCSMSQAPNG